MSVAQALRSQNGAATPAWRFINQLEAGRAGIATHVQISRCALLDNQNCRHDWFCGYFIYGDRMLPKKKIFERQAETAEYFKISVMTLWRWSQDPLFPRPLKRGRVVLYDLAAIERWLAK